MLKWDKQRKKDMNIIELQKKYGISALTAEVLHHAQLTEEQIKQILYPKNTLLSCQCEAIDAAAQRILQAKQNNEKVFIGGDYDADGIMATIIMKETLDQLGIENGFYIPNRFNEGYGLSANTVKAAYQKGYHLIITVDNGVVQKEAIDLCHELGMEILITDHHIIQEQLNWDYLVHPTCLPEGFNTLCGAGVALQLSRALIPENRKHVVLAMLATLADMMPLFDENRSIVICGLDYLNQDGLYQLEVLLDRPILHWDEKEISFQIIPKINAIGRLADQANANNLVRYFLLKDPLAIQTIASQIKEINNKRKKLSEKMASLALLKASDTPFIVVDDESFHEGLVGLVANRLMITKQKPVAVFTKKDQVYRGSVRSYGNLDLMVFFDDLKAYCIKFGGHQAAAGIEISEENYELVKNKIQEKIQMLPPLEKKEKYISISSELCTIAAITELNSLAPFGQGFEKPTFCISHFDVIQTQVLKERYPKWKCKNDAFEFEAISFSLSKESIEKPVSSFIGQLDINHFRGKKTLSILIEDLKVY